MERNIFYDTQTVFFSSKFLLVVASHHISTAQLILYTFQEHHYSAITTQTPYSMPDNIYYFIVK